jgi:hypothetical protein
MQVLHASILAEGMEEDNLLKKKIKLKTGSRGLFFHKNCLRIRVATSSAFFPFFRSFSAVPLFGFLCFSI